MTLPKQAMCLAAGKGERLRPFTDHWPKPMVPLANRPVIAWNLEWLRKHGVEEVIVNTFHLGDKLKSYLGHGSSFGLTIRYSDESTLLGTGGGILQMLKHIQEDSFYCINADMFNYFDLRQMHEAHQLRQSSATMALTRSIDGLAEGLIYLGGQSVNQAHEIVGMLDSLPEANRQTTACHFLGVHLFRTAFLRNWEAPSGAFCINRQGYLPWHLGKRSLHGFLVNQPLHDTGTVERLLNVNRALLQQKPSGYPAKPYLRVKPPLVIAETAEIGTDCQIGPNVAIGARAHIGKGTSLQNCIVLEDTELPGDQRYENALLTPF